MSEKISSMSFVQPENKERLSLDGAKGTWTGADYIESLNDGRVVWYDGEKIDVRTHPKFFGLLKTLADLYDSQHEKQNVDIMTYESETTGNRVSYSYMAPENREQLDAKWRNSHKWMGDTFGLMARLPDFMSNVVVGLYGYRNQVAGVGEKFRENIEAYYEYCKEHDVSITHAIGDPQIDRSASLKDNPEFALRVTEVREDGIVVNGAKTLATLSPYCHEALIYLSPSFAKREDPSYVAWFAVPMATVGLSMLCRESHTKESNGHRHYLGNHYDEQDAILFFENVFIPMKRVFLLNDADVAFQGFFRLNQWALYAGQIRFYHRLQTFVGVASLVSKAIGVNGFREIQNQLGELTAYSELIRMSLVAMDAEASVTDSGLLAPASTLAADTFSAQITTRIAEIVRTISGSGIVMQPSIKDLETPELKPLIDLYMRGKDCGADYKAILFRVAWELVSDAFGSRQEIYEYWNRGDVVRNRIHLYGISERRRDIEQKLESWFKSF